MNKSIKYIIFTSILGVSLYYSIYIKALDEVKQVKSDDVFNAKSFANQFISSKTETLPALNTSDFLNNILKDVKKYSEANGNKLGISNDYYFITEGNATVLSIEEEDIVVSLSENDKQHIRIATDFIFGNAIREGAKVANIGDFHNTMDYNNISVELNNIIRETIIPPFMKRLKRGNNLYFKGAVKVNTKKPILKELRVIPIILKLNN